MAFIPSDPWPTSGSTASGSLRCSRSSPCPRRRQPAVSGVLFDRRYRTASMPVVDAAPVPAQLLGDGHRLPTPAGRARSPSPDSYCWPPASAGAALLLWGYIAPRYLADFVPFLVLASAVAMADIWRRMEGRSRRAPDRGVHRHHPGRPCSPSWPTSAWPSYPTRSGTRPRCYNFVETQKIDQRHHRPPAQGQRAPGDTASAVGPGRRAVHHRRMRRPVHLQRRELFDDPEPAVHRGRRGWRSSGATPSSAPSASPPITGGQRRPVAAHARAWGRTPCRPRPPRPGSRAGPGQLQPGAAPAHHLRTAVPDHRSAPPSM